MCIHMSSVDLLYKVTKIIPLRPNSYMLSRQYQHLLNKLQPQQIKKDLHDLDPERDLLGQSSYTADIREDVNSDKVNAALVGHTPFYAN